MQVVSKQNLSTILDGHGHLIFTRRVISALLIFIMDSFCVAYYAEVRYAT